MKKAKKPRQTDLAALLGVSQSTVSRMLNGESGITREDARKIAEYSKGYYKVRDLMGRKNDLDSYTQRTAR